jgi:hypothetical protein
MIASYTAVSSQLCIHNSVSRARKLKLQDDTGKFIMYYALQGYVAIQCLLLSASIGRWSMKRGLGATNPPVQPLLKERVSS